MSKNEMKQNKREKELELIKNALADRKFAKTVHKALKRQLRKWLHKEKNSLPSNEQWKVQLKYITYNWADQHQYVRLTGSHNERATCIGITKLLQFLSHIPSSEDLRLRGLIEVCATVKGQYQYFGRAFCIWEDEFNLLVGTVLAEYRLLRVLKKQGFFQKREVINITTEEVIKLLLEGQIKIKSHSIIEEI